MVSGFRFENVPLPVDAVILAAHLEFRIDGTYSNPLAMRFFGEFSTYPLPFSTINPPHSRPLTYSFAD